MRRPRCVVRASFQEPRDPRTSAWASTLFSKEMGRALAPFKIRRTHPERFYSFWALGLHGLSFLGMLPVSTWYVALATGLGSVAHSATWNRRYYHLGYDFLLHWSPFLWIQPDWDPKGLVLLGLTLMFYVTYQGGIENVVDIYRDAKCAYLEEDYLERSGLRSATDHGLESPFMSSASLMSGCQEDETTDWEKDVSP